MASWQWGRTMVTIDGCKLLVDHGEAQGVGVTKLPKLRQVDAQPTEPASMAERGLALGTGVTADIHMMESSEMGACENVSKKSMIGGKLES